MLATAIQFSADIKILFAHIYQPGMDCRVIDLVDDDMVNAGPSGGVCRVVVGTVSITQIESSIPSLARVSGTLSDTGNNQRDQECRTRSDHQNIKQMLICP